MLTYGAVAGGANGRVLAGVVAAEDAGEGADACDDIAGWLN